MYKGPIIKEACVMKRLAKLFLLLSAVLLLSPTPAALAAPYSSKSEHIICGYPGTKGTILYRKGYVLDKQVRFEKEPVPYEILKRNAFDLQTSFK